MSKSPQQGGTWTLILSTGLEDQNKFIHEVRVKENFNSPQTRPVRKKTAFILYLKSYLFCQKLLMWNWYYENNYIFQESFAASQSIIIMVGAGGKDVQIL